MTPEKHQNDEMFIFGIGAGSNLSSHGYVKQF
jgi:hypothetical protein